MSSAHMTFEVIRIKHKAYGHRGFFYWRLKARNGKILCHSEQYTTKRAAKAAVHAIRIENYFKTEDLTK